MNNNKKDILSSDEEEEEEDENEVIPSLQSFIKGDVLGIDDLSFSGKCNKEEDLYITPRQSVYTFFEVPRQLERLILYGIWICLDSFLFFFTFLPLRILISMIHLFGSTIFPKKIKLTASQSYDLLRGSIMIITVMMLLFFDTSVLYHYIRGQAVLKLYAIFNVLDILDRLCCSLAKDIFDSLVHVSLRNSLSYMNRKRNNNNNNSIMVDDYLLNDRLNPYFGPFMIYFIAVGYTFFHSFLIFIRIITLNVSINSYNNSLLTLLITNNFVELKTNVFKNFREENLFQITCNDMVERFQLFIFLFMVIVHNLNDASWKMSYQIAIDIIYVISLVFILEVIVDWIKHSFIIKFNMLKPNVYIKFSRIISNEVISYKNNRMVIDRSCNTARRIGYHPLPVVSVILRLFLGVAPISGFLGIIWIFLMWVFLLLLKGLTTMIVLSKSATREIKSERKLKNIYPYHKID